MLSQRERRTLPPINQPQSAGLKARKLGGNRVVYQVEALPERASSVPLRQSAASKQQDSPLTVQKNSSDMIEDFFTSSSHASVKGVAGWKKLLDGEKSQFHSISMWGELMLQKVIKETAHHSSPNPLRTAVCCMLLHKIAPLMGTAESLMKNLLHELFNAIYFSWEEYLQDKFIQGGNEEDEASGEKVGIDNPYDKGAMSIGPTEKDDPTSLKFFVSSLNHRYTYFQLLDELQSARVRVIGLPSRVIVRCMELWRFRLLLIVFTLWRGDTLKIRSRRKKVNAEVEFLFRRKCKKRLHEHLHAWRNYVVERRHRNIQDHEATQKKLQQRMGRHIQALEKENEDLKRQLATLRTTHTTVVIQLTNMLSLLESFKKVARDETIDDIPPINHSDGDVSRPSQTGTASQSVNEASLTPPVGASDDAQRHNLAALFPELTKKRSLSIAVPLSDQGMREIEAEAKKVAEGPNRLQQLKDFLDMENGREHQKEALAASAHPEDNNLTKNGNETKAFLPTTTASEPKVSYSDVLDWVSMRTQLMVMSLQPHSQGLRRCTNFTIDFKDSIRLACLLVSLGADRSLVEDVAVISNLVDRAALAIKMSRCFFTPTDSVWSDLDKLDPQDIVKGKGGKISKLIFGFYRKFSTVALVIPPGPLTDEIGNALREAGGFTTAPMRPLSPAQLGDELLSNELLSPNSNSNSSPGGRGMSHFGEFVDDQIPEMQFATWFKELAATDSDDEATNFFDVTLGSSVANAVTEKMQRRMSRLSFTKGSPPSPSNSRRKKSKTQELTESMIRWVKTKISLQYEGKDVPNFGSMSAVDVLQCVLQSMFPKMSFYSHDPLTRLKRMQECLVKKLHLTKVTLGKEMLKKRDHFSEDDINVPMKELLMILYFFDQDIVVSI